MAWLEDLDTHTIFLALLVSGLVSTLFSLLLLRKQRRFKGAGMWVAAQLASTISVSLSLLAGYEYNLVNVLLNTGFLASPLLFAHSMWCFRRQEKFPRVLYLSLPVVLLYFSLSAPLALGTRMFIFSLLSMGFYAFAMGVTLKDIPRASREAGLIASLPFALMVAGNLLRLPLALDLPADATFIEISPSVKLIYLLAVGLFFLLFSGYYHLSDLRLEAMLMERQERILQQNQTLEELNRSHQTVLSLIAHDLASPLSSASRLADSWLKTPEEQRQHSQTQFMEALAIYLSYGRDFLQNVLAWTRASGENFRYSPEAVDRTWLETRLMSSLGFQAIQKSIQLDLVTPAFDQGPLLLDPVVLGILIHNLVGNALKFTPSGGRVVLKMTKAPGGLELSVEDNGPGIPPKLLARLQDQRQDLPSSSPGSHGEKGSGLGIRLCQTYLSRIGSTLEIASTPGEGSRFTFWIPVPERPEAGPKNRLPG